MEAVRGSIGEAPLEAPRLPFGEQESAYADAPEAVESERSLVTELLGPSPVAVDELVRHSGAPARLVQLVLLELELAGRLERHRGGRVSLRP